jgi:hypothetical protein
LKRAWKEKPKMYFQLSNTNMTTYYLCDSHVINIILSITVVYVIKLTKSQMIV